MYIIENYSRVLYIGEYFLADPPADIFLQNIFPSLNKLIFCEIFSVSDIEVHFEII